MERGRERGGSFDFGRDDGENENRIEALETALRLSRNRAANALRQVAKLKIKLEERDKREVSKGKNEFIFKVKRM